MVLVVAVPPVLATATVKPADALKVDCSILYAVMPAPPLLDGAVHDKATCVSPGVGTANVEGPGTVAGVCVSPTDAIPVPTEFVADTLNQYAWPLVRPVMVLDVAVLPVLATATAKPADALVVDCSIL
jgi:hypothetical protein